MTTHLSDAEFVDHAEGGLAPARAAHLASCSRCREQADALAGILAEVANASAPEPSPLYWEHLSAAVRERVAEPVANEPRWWLRPVAFVPVVALVVLAAVVASLRAPAPTSAPGAAVAARSQAASVSTPVAGPPATDPAWELLASTAADANLETAGAPGSGFDVGTSAIDSAVMQLSPAETEELGRLLQDEIKRSGA